MWIIIFILKILGILLAAILAVLVLVLAYLLFAPVTYRAKGERRTAAELEVAGYDLLRLVRVFVTYKEKEWRYGVKLLWGLIGKERTQSQKEDTKSEEPVRDNRAEDTSPTDKTDDHKHAEDDAEADDHKHAEDDAEAEDHKHVETDVKTDDPKPKKDSRPASDSEPSGSKDRTDQQPKAEPEKRKSKKSARPSPDTGNFREPREPDEAIAEPEEPEPVGSRGASKEEPGRAEKLQKLLSHPGNQQAFSLLWNGGLRLLYRVRPRLKKVDGSFSTGAPDMTGELVGAIAVLPAAHGGNVRLNPDFESDKPYATGIVDIYGRLQLCFVAAFALRVIASRDCRRLYRQVRKL